MVIFKKMPPRPESSRAADEEHREKDRLAIITEEIPSVVCIFCKSSIIDEVNLGPLYRRSDVVTHYFCMLFSAALKQNGTDDQGILGFLTPDIQQEIRRSFRLKCFYCGHTGASVGCCNKRCKEIFHFRCGLTHGACFQFHGKFESYCANHVKHKIPILPNCMKEQPCPICMSPMTTDETLVAGSCCKLSLFHKECIQKMALSAGYFFKCPMCNLTKRFIQEMRSCGIYVPEQDASWEKDNAFHELYVRYSNCDAEICSCKFGRHHVSDKGSWSMARCRLCGAAGIHKHCGKLTSVEKWACEPCLEVERKAELENKTAKKKKSNGTVDLAVAGSSRASSIYSASTLVSHVESSSEESDRFELRDIAISANCFSYFPYNKQALKKLQGMTVPDWRMMTLSVNLCRWIPSYEREKKCSKRRSSPISSYSSPSLICPINVQSQRSLSVSCSRQLKRTLSMEAELELEAQEVHGCGVAELYNEQGPVIEAIYSSDTHILHRVKKKKMKRSSWSAGIVKQRTKRFREAKKRRLQEAMLKREKSISVEIQEDEDERESYIPASIPDIPPILNENEESQIDLESNEIGYADLSRDEEMEQASPNLIQYFPPVVEPTPEQDLVFRALGDRLRNELSQNRNNNRENIHSRHKSLYLSIKEGHHRRKQWFSPEKIKERQLNLGESEL